MQIHAPIFINSFSRGGSNMMWNVFLTHPDVCSPIWETLEIFRVGWQKPTLEGYTAAALARQWRLFDQKYLAPRQPLSPRAAHYIDETLYLHKLDTFANVDMKYKADGVTYTLDEVKAARLCAKNNNGLAFLSDPLMTMYPDATFFALVRNPLALYESYRRHKFITSVSDFISFYRKIGRKMMDDSQRWPSYHLVKFEDLVNDPVAVAQRVYPFAGLDFAKITKMRFKAKAYFNAQGRHTTTGDQYTIGRHYWFDFARVGDFVEPAVNVNQIKRLDKRDVAAIAEQIGDIAEVFGYGAELAEAARVTAS